MNIKFKAVLLSGMALSLWGQNAMAADIAPAAASWTGIYLGVGGGGAYSIADVDAAGYGVVMGDDDGWEGPFIDETGTEFGGGSFGGDDYFFAGTFAQIGRGVAFEGGPDAEGFDNQVADLLNRIANGDADDSGQANAFGLVKVGADLQIGSSFVVGVTADYRLGSTGMEESAAALTGLEGEFTNGADLAGYLTSSVELENNWSVGGRAGFLPADNILLFVAGGYASAKASLDTSFDAAFDYGGIGYGGDVEFDLSSKNSDWLHGFYVGGGAEMMLTENIMAGFEYRYLDLGTLNTSVEYWDGDPECCLDIYAGVGGEASITSHSLSATISYKFGL
jgi:opacity protein-like surface antigen